MKITMKGISNALIGGLTGYFAGLLFYLMIGFIVDFIGIYNIEQHDMWFNFCLICSRLGILLGMYISETKVRPFG